METKPRIYIDMDHTFCDFIASLPYWKERGLTEIEKRCPWSQKGFFSSLLPMEGALEFWHKWYDTADLWFLTRPSIPNRHCYTEKADWVFKYLGEDGVKRLILSPRKDFLIGDILIDDASNCGQTAFKGVWFQFGSEKYPDWKAVDSSIEDFYSKRLL